MSVNNSNIKSGLVSEFGTVSDCSTAKGGNTGEHKKPSPRVTLRLTEDENARLNHLSQGMTISSYIRKCVFGDKTARRKRRSYRPAPAQDQDQDQDQESLAKALALLGQSRITNNLNQLAHHANMGTLTVDEKALNQINEAYEQVTSMRDQLIKALGLIEQQ